ncbi:hypothetical protein BC829DRAFT_439078 [Chytridium lagenaria]|nr:hypothetical protein BC829DRAFT_439078 [Chytridium lagenaria]
METETAIGKISEASLNSRSAWVERNLVASFVWVAGHRVTCSVVNMGYGLFSTYEGFRRISFHQDYVFVCFSSVDTSTLAIDRIHEESDMLAAYAKHGVASNTTPSISVPPNPILYVSVFPYFTETELIKIFKSYEGFDSCRFFPNHALVRFTSVECSKKALEDLNGTTNLFANYSTKGAKSATELRGKNSRSSIDDGRVEGAVGPVIPTITDMSAGSASPKCTIHVTNLDREIPILLDFFKGLQGFRRVAFYVDYAFVIFEDPHYSSMAIEEILFGTKMKASFAKAEYSPHCIPANTLGTPNAIIRVSDYPASISDTELEGIFESFEGWQDIVFYHSSCLVHFKDVITAHACLEEMNSTTNFTAIFSRKGAAASLSSNAPPSVVTQASTGRPAAVIPSSLSFNSIIEFPGFPVPLQPEIPVIPHHTSYADVFENKTVLPLPSQPPYASPPIMADMVNVNDAFALNNNNNNNNVNINNTSSVPPIFSTHEVTRATSSSPLSLSHLPINIGENGNNLSSSVGSDQTAADSELEEASPEATSHQSQSEDKNLPQQQPSLMRGPSLSPLGNSFYPNNHILSHQAAQGLDVNQPAFFPSAPSFFSKAPTSVSNSTPPHLPQQLQQQPLQQQQQQQPQQQQPPYDALTSISLESQLWTTKNLLDAMFHRIVTLEAENDALRRREAERSFAFSSVAVAAEATAGNSGGEVDWKVAYERAVEEVVGLRGELERRNGEYERLEVAHKNCGYLQGLLAICD